MAKSKPTKMLAVLGRSRRTGRWTVASRSSVLALLGSCHLDMTHSSIDGDQFKMKVTVLLGSTTFVLPPGAVVKPSGMSLLAGSTVDVPEQEDDAGLPILEIEWTAILGRLRIVTATADQEREQELGAAVAELPGGPDRDARPGAGSDEARTSAVAADGTITRDGSLDGSVTREGVVGEVEEVATG